MASPSTECQTRIGTYLTLLGQNATQIGLPAIYGNVGYPSGLSRNVSQGMHGKSGPYHLMRIIREPPGNYNQVKTPGARNRSRVHRNKPFQAPPKRKVIKFGIGSGVGPGAGYLNYCPYDN